MPSHDGLSALLDRRSAPAPACATMTVLSGQCDAQGRMPRRFRPAPQMQSLLRELSEVAQKHGVTIADVACRWVLDKPQVGGAARDTRQGARRRLGCFFGLRRRGWKPQTEGFCSWRWKPRLLRPTTVVHCPPCRLLASSWAPATPTTSPTSRKFSALSWMQVSQPDPGAAPKAGRCIEGPARTCTKACLPVWVCSLSNRNGACNTEWRYDARATPPAGSACSAAEILRASHAPAVAPPRQNALPTFPSSALASHRVPPFCRARSRPGAHFESAGRGHAVNHRLLHVSDGASRCALSLCWFDNQESTEPCWPPVAFLLSALVLCASLQGNLPLPLPLPCPAAGSAAASGDKRGPKAAEASIFPAP